MIGTPRKFLIVCTTVALASAGSLASESGTFSILAERSIPAPVGTGTITRFWPGLINDFGEIMVLLKLMDTIDGEPVDNIMGLFLYSGGEFIEIARERKPAPDDDGLITRLPGATLLNDYGEVAFSADVDGDGILYLRMPDGYVQLAKVGQLVAEGDLAFKSLGGSGMNAAGQVVLRRRSATRMSLTSPHPPPCPVTGSSAPTSLHQRAICRSRRSSGRVGLRRIVRLSNLRI